MVEVSHAEKLRRAGIELPAWRIPVTERLVAGYEREFGLELPVDYRSFLLELGGCTLAACVPFLEPTPVGTHAAVNSFYGFMSADRQGSDVRWATRLIDGAPDVVAVARCQMGGMIWLRCTGKSAGSVYFHDGERRGSRPDSWFRDRFSALDPSIESYLALRRSGSLPEKPLGHQDVYLLARSFTAFLDALEPEPFDE